MSSRAKLSYKGVQAELDAGTENPVLQLLKEVGRKRVELERQRGGASLNMPEQEIVLFERLSGLHADHAVDAGRGGLALEV